MKKKIAIWEYLCKRCNRKQRVRIDSKCAKLGLCSRCVNALGF